MVESPKMKVLAVDRVTGGDLVVTFSDGTIVLYHAQFLYDMRNHDSNIEVVEPFD